MRTTVESYIQDRGLVIQEGGCFEEQRAFFRSILLSKPEIKTVLEVGFNAGSAIDTILAVRSDITAVSFDIMRWDYTPVAKQYIDATYPGRHLLVPGDSVETIPRYKTNIRFDLIFIDGGHAPPVPELDLRNCGRLAHPGTLIVMDDYCETHGVGVIEAWDSAVSAGVVIQIGEPTSFEEGERGWVMGKYVLG